MSKKVFPRIASRPTNSAKADFASSIFSGVNLLRYFLQFFPKANVGTADESVAC
jgi:hypothetical protein